MDMLVFRVTRSRYGMLLDGHASIQSHEELVRNASGLYSK